ncbi:sulfotransferase [Roseovarius sp. LXJ103]|uniref:sulfotransferase n=1 Tax=Roseovarius carneus TaxID=2853164 RepID=UPI000D621BFC|nr:sulfotransferase [Roseovarius carneus]MBZ8117990.1 sulfotransferase [Roseovarius carneus]PWE36261.1 sulfotransferase [Pelagicola sp. LXJ1103]
MSQGKLLGTLFLGVGAMKAGTTWLYTVLDQHPELHFCPEKEVHYFYHRYANASQLSETRRLENVRERYLLRFDPERANIDRVRQNLHWISAYLSGPVDDHWYRGLFQMRRHHRYACDFSNLSAHLPADVWPRIEAGCDRLRVLYTMRDPLKRLWSHTKFHLQITGQLEALEAWGPTEFEEFVRHPFIWDNAEYGRVLRSLGAGLSQGAWQAFFYEEMHADQRGTLARIENFLGVAQFDYPQALLDRRVTESVQHPMPSFFADLFAQDIARIKAEVCAEGYALPATWG